MTWVCRWLKEKEADKAVKKPSNRSILTTGWIVVPGLVQVCFIFYPYRSGTETVSFVPLAFRVRWAR